MFNTHGLIAVLILALINAKAAVTENDYYPGKIFFYRMFYFDVVDVDLNSLHFFSCYLFNFLCKLCVVSSTFSVNTLLKSWNVWFLLVIMECAKELTYAYQEISATLFIALIYIKTLYFSFQNEIKPQKKRNFFFVY